MGVVQRGDKTEVKQAPGHPPGQELEMKWSLPSISHVVERSGCRGETGFEADSHCGCCDRLPQEVGGVARRPAEPKGMSSSLVQKCCFLIQEGERSRETAS